MLDVCLIFKMTPQLRGEMLQRSAFVAEKVQQLLVTKMSRANQGSPASKPGLFYRSGQPTFLGRTISSSSPHAAGAGIGQCYSNGTLVKFVQGRMSDLAIQSAVELPSKQLATGGLLTRSKTPDSDDFTTFTRIYF
jgi:hypothetical protein